ncbi:MAG TPA: BON domain-containing protein [Gemmatimonadetes bacterium]|nr:BON domain-containing protein [Gemmatimonadota bacterium]
MNRRDFLLLKTRGQERVLELSCERLYMRHTDAKSGALRASGGSGDPESWEGEPPLEMVTPTTDDLLRELDEELASADVLHVLDRDWLVAGAFRGPVEARIDAFRRRGGRVEYPASARRAVRSGAGVHLSLAFCLLAATALGGCASDGPEIPPDDVLQERVEAAIARASDVPADAITVVVIDGVVTVTGSVVCEECGGRRTPGGFGTVQQSLGAVVRAIPGVQSVEFDLQYERRAGPPPGASGGAGG